MNSLFRIALCIVAFVNVCQSELNFYGFTEEISSRGKLFKQTWLGTVQLENSHLTVNSMGNYLDITEDAWVSGNLLSMNIQNLTDKYMIKGNFQLSSLAVVTGLITWRGEQAYRAVLQKSSYIKDSSFPDSSAFESSLDSRIGLIQQLTETNYEVTFCRVNLGERIHIRIRYLLPNDSKGLTQVTVPVLMSQLHASNPRDLKLAINAGEKQDALTLTTKEGRQIINNSKSLVLPFTPSFILSYLPGYYSRIQLTSFDEGPWRGNYVIVNSLLTDSIIYQLSKPVSTIFVWRWNETKGIVTHDGTMKTLSPLGLEIVTQAQQFENVVKELHKLGNKCGFIHSIEGNSEVIKEISPSDSSINLILRYLEQFHEQTLFRKYADLQNVAPSWVPQQQNPQDAVSKSQNEFLQCIKKASSYLADTTILNRHVVIKTIGNTDSPIEPENLQNKLIPMVNKFTVAHSGSWRGVDLTNSFSNDYKEFFEWQGFPFPPFTPSVIQMRLKSSNREYFFPTKQSNQMLHATLRSTELFDSSVAWIGFDNNGYEISRFQVQSVVKNTLRDSGLVKIWAGDENHFTDREEVYPGGTFGIVTKSTFLQATKSTISIDENNGVAFLRDEEIFAPKTATSLNPKNLIQNKVDVKLTHDFLSINSKFNITTLKIIDLQGREMLIVDLRIYQIALGQYRIPLVKLLKGKKYFKKLFLCIDSKTIIPMPTLR